MQNAKTEPWDIRERTVAYAVRIIRWYKVLSKESAGRVVGSQLLRAGTSIGANVHEANCAQSKADFVSKMQIALKEARECGYWLRLIGDAGLVADKRLSFLRDETEQLTRILATIVVRAKKPSPS